MQIKCKQIKKFLKKPRVASCFDIGLSSRGRGFKPWLAPLEFLKKNCEITLVISRELYIGRKHYEETGTNLQFDEICEVPKIKALKLFYH